MNETFDMRESLPTTSTVMRRPPEQKLNLMTTSLETTCIDSRNVLSRRRLDDKTDFIDEEHPVKTPKVKTNRRVIAVNAMTPLDISNVSVVQRRSLRMSVRVNDSPIPVARAEKNLKIKRQVVPSYLNSSKTITKDEHAKQILGIINKGSFKQINILPSIGQKTAFQIMSYRAMNGFFKELKDVKKVPSMKGKRWDKFLEVCFVVVN